LDLPARDVLAIVAKSVPFKPNLTSIGTALSASRNKITDYCLFIEEAGMIDQLRNATGGIMSEGCPIRPKHRGITMVDSDK